MMLHMQNYCQLLFLVIFILSTFGSITRSDYNATYSLFSYIYLATHKGKTSLSHTLINLLIMTFFFIGADVWGIIIQNQAQQSKIVGTVIIGIQIALKLFLFILMAIWKFRGQTTNQSDFQPKIQQ